MKKYRKKPVVIEARQLTGPTAEAHSVYLWIEANTLGSFEPLARIEGQEPWPASGVSIDPRDGRMIIATLEGGQDHPRLRGEHRFLGHSNPTVTGSSPPSRGARHNRGHQIRAARIIPAFAGSTS